MVVIVLIKKIEFYICEFENNCPLGFVEICTYMFVHVCVK